MDIPANYRRDYEVIFPNLKKEEETWIRKIRKTN